MKSEVTIQIDQYGQGDHLVMLHSLLCDKDSFGHIKQELSSSFKLIIPSLPGYGGSSYMDASISDVVNVLVDKLAQLKINKFNLLGNGYGGFVALSMAQQYPDRVNKLILLDSASYFPPLGKEAVLKMKTLVEAGGMESVTSIALDRLFPDDFKKDNQELVDHYKNALLGFDTKTFVRVCQNLIDVDLREGLGRIVCPTLVAVGLKDAATPPALAKYVADNIKNAEYIEIEDCGHAPHVQMPEKTLNIVTHFLNQR